MEHSKYIVEYPRKSEFAEAAIIDVTHDYTRFVSCPKCGARVSGAYWARPREVVLTKQNAPDFLYTYCDNAPFVISEKALCEISQAGLKGITCAEEIETVRFQRKAKKERALPKYFHIELARSCITINHQKSEIVYGNQRGIACPLCRQIPATYDFCRSLSFCMDFFEGYDIFQIYELGETVFLSQKFVDFYKNSTLSNLHFTPAEKYGAWEASYFLDGNEDA